MASQVLRADRRAFLQRGAALGGMGLLGGCATLPAAMAQLGPGPGHAFRPPPPLAPIKAHADRIMDVTVCLRPFRAAGPRLDVETVGDKTVVHNYGHGGSGWSLSWGSGLIAVRNALEGGERDIAVIGCGALGLTAATLAQRAGARVTIYAKDRMPEVRSARATGIWSPDSRIALESAVDAGFAARWEEMARASFRFHRRYLGLADAPVEWTDTYDLLDSPPTPRSGPRLIDFVRYEHLVSDLTPPYQDLDPGQHPFRARYVARSSMPMFNLAEYGHVLINDFLLGGGRLETVEFHTPGDLTALKQKVVINCTGYGARALWRDESIVPVRGQLAVLIPQPEVTYGVSYHSVGTVSRRDGLIVQAYGGEAKGYNDSNEAPDREEAIKAVQTIAEVFKGVPGA